MRDIISVSALVNSLKLTIENNLQLQNIYVKGELSRVTYQSSGHVYFSLKDEHSSIDCTLWKSYAQRLPFKLQEGMKVVILGSPSIYSVRGSLQFNARDVINDGEGALYIALQQLKQELQKAGLFDEAHKKPLPEYPLNIGIISGKNAAGLKDVISIIKRRWPIANIHLYESLVQGEKASKEMITALTKADQANEDVLLLVRGGGSIEDLWCFNDKALATCIYNLQTPIVTGIGHEIDFTIAEMVSDKRASTPSAAAELITPDYHVVLKQLQTKYQQILTATKHLLTTYENKLTQIKNEPVFKQKDYLYKDYNNRLVMDVQSLLHQDRIINQKRNHLLTIKQALMKNATELVDNDREIINKKLNKLLQINLVNNQKYQHNLKLKTEVLINAMQQQLFYNKSNLVNLINKLDALSPLKILARGYSVTKKGKVIVSSIDQVSIGDEVNILLSDGNLVSEIKAKEEKSNGKIKL